MALKDSFPDLFDIVCVNNASITAHLKFSSGSTQWNVSFVRAAYDCEMDVFASFFRVLYSIRVGWEGENKFWWVPSKRGVFVVRSFYNVLARNDGLRFPWKSVWWTKVSLRAAFFAWLAALWKIVTIDKLKKQHVIVVDWCCMCKKNGESVDHCLLHCEVVGTLWDVFFNRFWLSWVMPRRVVDLYACWLTVRSAQSVAVWKMLPSCLLWCLWRWMIEVLRTVRGPFVFIIGVSGASPWLDLENTVQNAPSTWVRTVRGLLRSLSRYFSIFCIFGQQLLFLIWWLVIMISLFSFLSVVRCFLMYASCVSWGTLRF